MLRCLALALSVVVVARIPAAAQPSRAQQVAIMDSIAESPIIEGRVAGLAVAVIRGSDTLLMKGYGMADLEWQVPMTVDAVFEIGSVTKQFTAAAVLKLRDEGKLDLDADLSRYLPEFDAQGHRIPVRRALPSRSSRRWQWCSSSTGSRSRCTTGAATSFPGSNLRHGLSGIAGISAFAYATRGA